MSVFIQAVILGIVQGLTEFLPISSSGHLVLMQHFLGIETPQVMFDVLLHGGTLIALTVFFRSEILKLVIQPNRSNLQYVFYLILATVITVAILFPIRDSVESLFNNVHKVSWALILTGSILWISARFHKVSVEEKEVGWKTAVLMGLAQALAAVPGISRSGVTIAAGLMCQKSAYKVFRFSMLMSMAVILAAIILKLMEREPLGIPVPAAILGVTAAAITGLGALTLLKRFLMAGHFGIFAYYCWFLGVWTLVSMR